MPWQATILFYVTLSAARVNMNRKIGTYKRDLSLYTLATSFVFVGSLGVFIALTNMPAIDSSAAWGVKHHILLGGALIGIANVLMIKMYRFLPASVGVFISLFNTVSVIIFAGIFTEESITSSQWYGACFLACSIILVAYLAEKNSNKNKHIKHLAYGIAAGIGSALTLGPALVNENYVIKSIGIETYLLYGWGFQAISAFTIAFILSRKNRKKRKPKITRDMRRDVWIYSALLAIGGMSFVLSLNDSGNASIVMISGTARVALAVMMAYFFLKERQNLIIKLTGLVLSAIGLAILFN